MRTKKQHSKNRNEKGRNKSGDYFSVKEVNELF